MSVACLWACDDEDSLPTVKPSASGTFTDERDGNEYGWIRVGNLDWMTSNLKYGEPYNEKEYGGVFADPTYGDPAPVISPITGFDFEADYAENGNLYDWDEAQAACPEGWRLPSDEEWKRLEMALGMPESEANSLDWRGEGVADLLQQGDDGLGLNLGLSGCAWASGDYGNDLYLNDLDTFGWYWTSTENEDDGLEITTVFFRKIFYNYNTVCRRSTPLEILMRVRCVRDAE